MIFVHLLTRELLETGDRHYQAVTEALIQLKAVEKDLDFRLRMNAIRVQYKRRSNLIAMLDRAKL